MNKLFYKRDLQTGRIKGTNFSRILGALIIATFHYGCHCEAMQPYLTSTVNFDYGSFAVGAFFALSGACLSRTYTKIDLKQYIVRRWLAIFPMFYVAYLVYGLIHALNVGPWWEAYPVIRFLLTVVGMDGYFCYKIQVPYLLGEWFLGAIIFCYIAYPFLKKVLEYMPTVALIVLWVGAYFIPFLDCFDNQPFRNPWTCITLFYTGMFISQHPKMLTNRISLIISLVILGILSTVKIPHTSIQLTVILSMISGIALFITSVQMGDIIDTQFNEPQLIKLLGRLSYPIFLVQHLVVYNVSLRWYSPTTEENILPLLFSLIVTIFFAWMLSIIVEKIISLFHTSQNPSISSK